MTTTLHKPASRRAAAATVVVPSAIRPASAVAANPVRALREKMGLSQRIFVRLLSVSERSLASLEAGASPSESAQRRLCELARLQEALAQVIEPDAVGAWLQQPNEAFGGLKPLEVVERGESDRLWRMVFFAESGVSS